MSDLANTGERILLEKETPFMIARHFCAYKFSSGYVRDKSVLDIGCGEGYGSHYLAGFAKEVTAIDYDDAIIDYARNKYQRGNLRFRAMDAKAIDTIGAGFDVICSFQFIEHLRDAENFVFKAKNLLKEDGLFICSTPNREDASPGSAAPFNKFHIKEYLLEEFRALMAAHFRSVDMSGLKRAKLLSFYRRVKKIGLFNFLPGPLNPVKRFYERAGCGSFVIVKDGIETALDFFAVCKR